MLAHDTTEGGGVSGSRKTPLRSGGPGPNCCVPRAAVHRFGCGCAASAPVHRGMGSGFCDLRIGQGCLQFPSRQRQRRGISCHLIITVSDRLYLFTQTLRFCQGTTRQRRRPPPVADEGRSCWGRGQQGRHECNPLHEVDVAGAKRLRGLSIPNKFFIK